jgi:transcriptional regulator with XRE-family HTH domain
MSDPSTPFSEWLQAEMARLGYSTQGDMSKFSRSCEVHNSIIWRTLNGGRVPSLDVLRRIGNGLGYTLGEMIVAAGEATADELFVAPASPPKREVHVPELPPRQPRYVDPAEQHIWDTPILEKRRRLMLIDFLRLIRKHE